MSTGPSTSSSSASSPSTSSSSSSPCWNREGQYYPDTGEVDLTECGNICVCIVPDSIGGGSPVFNELSLRSSVPLQCRPDHHIRTTAALSARMASIRVPVVSDPRQWRSLDVPVNKSTSRYSTSGWQFFFQYVGGIPGRSEIPVILPNTVPRDTIKKDDLVLSAMVILPEADGDKQFWIPVTEQYKFALLETKEWTVIVLRDAIQLSEQ